MNQDVVSFVLRFVREMGEDQQARWRGVIKHVQSNSEDHFSHFSEAFQFMQGHVNEVIRSTFDESQKMNEQNPMLETAKLWGEFIPRYTQLMMDSMGDMMNPQTMSQQMEKNMSQAMAMWGLPNQQEQSRATATLESLADQVIQLTHKLDKLETRLAEMKASKTNLEVK